MRIIGITGGIGCGKSKLVRMAKAKCNCLVIDTDTVAKFLMAPGNISYELIVKRWPEVIDEDNTINRKTLAAITMSDKEALLELNEFTHPYVLKEIKDIIEREQENYDIAIIESALLLDTPIAGLCSETWNVTASMEKRIERLVNYRKYTREQAEAIMANQRSEDWYISNSTKTFINNADGGADMAELLDISLLEYK